MGDLPSSARVTLPAGGSVTVTFDVLVADPFSGPGTSFCNQGVVSGTGLVALLTDDPDVDSSPNVVRLFEHPRADDLENLGDLGRFVLNAVVLHDGLDGHEAPSVLQLPALEARATLEQLEALGCLEIDPADGRWFVPDDWYPAALRFLRRKNLLHV